MELESPKYWDEACDYLKKRDATMVALILPENKLKTHKNGFITLIKSIVSQQISVKAAEKIWQRLGLYSPQCAINASQQELFAKGLTKRKIEYIKHLAEIWVKQPLSYESFQNKTDNDVIEELKKIRGIGQWTAEMFLIFHLQRPDVLPIYDIALQKAIKQYYGNVLNIHDMRKLSEYWKPYRTVATWYFWRALDPNPVEY